MVGNAYAGVSGTGVGIVNIDGNGTKFQSAVLTVGHSGAGTLNLVNQGELELTGQSMTIAANSGSTGTVNIGAPAIVRETATVHVVLRPHWKLVTPSLSVSLQAEKEH
ncbi:hypothetical protein [Escherichia albertii]|uniref:hypothetical protein n=1 Tax=Escherichia albertii TaxID=208962 RepID=UPI003D6E2362